MVPGIKSTMDLPELHKNGRCPMLDLQVWAEEGREGEESRPAKIRHSFYQKDTTSPLVFHAAGAYSWSPKITTMSEEMRRRLLHMDVDHTAEDKDDVIRLPAKNGRLWLPTSNQKRSYKIRSDKIL